MRKATDDGDQLQVTIDGFQSPPSVRKATIYLAKKYGVSEISIPAFREEGDP